MGERLETQVVASFITGDVTGLGGASLQLVLDAGFSLGIGTRRLRLYPAVNAILRTNIGQVAKNGISVENFPREVLQFSGGNTAGARRPIANLISTTNFGSLFDRDGKTISVNFTVEGGSLKANKDSVFGAVEIAYDTTYLNIDYTGQDTSKGKGLTFDIGTVLAFFNGSVATFTVSPTDFQGDEGTELYRVISDAVAQGSTLFEFPPGWTGQAGSPTFDDGQPDPAIGSQTIERAHEIGFITSGNSIFTRTQFIPVEIPGKGAGVFNRVFKIKVGTVSEGGLTEEQLNSATAQKAIESAEGRFGL
jgi:hypothetical protein